MDAIAPTTTAQAVFTSADAPAKINLTLDVLGRRPDGYHDLRSLVIGVDLRDRVSLRAADGAGVALACSDPSLSGSDNLVVRAIEALAAYLGRPIGASVRLAKNIPVAAGLGGGSSDAAAVLRLCNHAMALGLTSAELASVGASVGSDIPLFFSLPSVVLTGRGECVRRAEMAWSGWAMLAFVGEPVSTAAVYSAWRPEDSAGDSADRIAAILSATGAEAITPLLTNDLEKAVYRVAPGVAEAARRVEGLGIGPVRVSGAGSTLFGLFDDRDDAERAARRWMDCNMGMGTAVVATPVASGPVYNEE